MKNPWYIDGLYEELNFYNIAFTHRSPSEKHDILLYVWPQNQATMDNEVVKLSARKSNVYRLHEKRR